MLLEIKNLYFAHSPEKPLFRNFNLRLQAGKILALAGESGCGKSTLLNLIYGLLDRESGEIYFEDRLIFGPKKNIVPGEKNMKLVAQHYDLMPYATVAENVGQFISNANLSAKKEKTAELLEVVGLEDFGKVLPKFLSGGQQQRVALARALSVLPKLLLLDEPFSNLDFPRKIDLRQRLFSFVRERGISLIISTHELQEILPWLDQIMVLQQGRLLQNDTPQEIYSQPYNAYVAELFGEVNQFSAAEQEKFQLSKNLWYAHEIKIATDGVPANVLESRFAGSYFWNKVKFDEKILTVYSEEKLEGGITLKF